MRSRASNHVLHLTVAPMASRSSTGLVTEALPLVREGGFFACELHETCLDEAARRLREAGCIDVKVTKDLVGRDRIVSGVCRDLQ